MFYFVLFSFVFVWNRFSKHLYSTVQVFTLVYYVTVTEVECYHCYSAQLFYFLPHSLWQQDGKIS